MYNEEALNRNTNMWYRARHQNSEAHISFSNFVSLLCFLFFFIVSESISHEFGSQEKRLGVKKKKKRVAKMYAGRVSHEREYCGVGST